MGENNTVAELTNGIILSEYKSIVDRTINTYQKEADLEEKLMIDLSNQGYERVSIHSSEDLYKNLKVQIEKLNDVEFSASEWSRFLDEYLNKKSDTLVEKTRKIQEDYVYDFIFDTGHIKNIKIIDKKNINNNYIQVTNQVTQMGTHKNRYDVTILINGLPLVQIELKKRGVPLSEAFNQIHRYTKESYNAEDSLFKYIQIFVISNGTNTRYFANTTAQNKNHYEFTCEWADAKNNTIADLEDFTATFLNKRTLLEVLTKYCVFSVDDVLLIMRPYQIAGTERILWKIDTSHKNKIHKAPNSGGYIWHTTGSGKTLTSFKTARLATEIDFIDKVFFVVDRKDLDYQTMKEYQKFQKDSVNGSKNTKELKESIEKEDNKIVVTTIQKLNEFIKKNDSHEIFNKQCVLIFDECHRSQFGEAQKNIKRKFKNYYLFGFTGTPIFAENSNNGMTTEDVFGALLHTYIITDAIRDGKVLKFKVDYNNVSSKFNDAEKETDEKKRKEIEKKMLLHPERIAEVTRHILDVYDMKTHRNEHYSVKERRLKGFNAMFAVQSIEASKMYYEEFCKQQEALPKEERLKVATIYSVVANEGQEASGTICEESFDTTALDSTNKEFLDRVIRDYNDMFNVNYSSEGDSFQNYYKDLAKRVKEKEVDILIVVGMFLTGFDAPTMNTLFVDKNLSYHGLIQAYSRTNRILNKVKPFGNIVCFRDLEDATKDAIKRFGDSRSIIIEKSYEEHMEGYTDDVTGGVVKGFKDLCNELLTKFEEPSKIDTDSDKKYFVKLFGEVLKAENILKNFDEFHEEEPIISERAMQDYKSAYVDIREEVFKKTNNDKGGNEEKNNVDFSDVEFEVELLKTTEINLDYILRLILENSRKFSDKEEFKEEVCRVIRANLGVRAKEELVLKYISQTDLKEIRDFSEISDSFTDFAKKEKEKAIGEVVENRKLKDNYLNFINKSLAKGVVSIEGGELDSILPPVSRRGGARERLKAEVLEELQKIVDVYMEIDRV